MCHPWLAAGVTGFAAVVIAKQLASIAAQPVAAETRSAHGLLGTRLRSWFRDRLRPLVEGAIAMGLTPNGVTLSQLAGSIVCGVAYGRGWLFTAGWLLIACGTLDVLDGEMARREGRDGSRGAFIDSVVDRYAESAVFAGLAVHYRDDWLLWGVLAAWVGAFLVSYVRARAESLGISCQEGMLQRPERYVLLGGASMIGTITTHLTCNVDARHHVLAAGVATLAVLANATALQRITTTLRRLA